jgi:hypothetical protein
MSIVPDPTQPKRQRLAHPTWCTRTDCIDSGEHTSRWHSVDSDRRNQLVEIDLRLSQGVIAPAPTWLEIAFRSGRDRTVYELNGQHARALKHVLSGLLADLR